MEPISRAFRSAAWVAGLLIAASLPAAADRTDVPILASGTSGAMGWVALTFTTNGDAAITEVLALEIGDAAIATHVYDAASILRYGLLFVSLDEPAPATVTEVGLPAAMVVDERLVETTGRAGDLGIFLTLNAPGTSAPKVGTFRVLLFAAGDAREWQWALRGGPGTRIDRIEQGTSTFLYTARDLEGPIHLERFDGASGMRAQVANTLSIPIADALFGGALALNGKHACPAQVCYGPPSTDALTVERPDALGVARCLCTFSAAPAGDYRFTLTGADATSAEDDAGLDLDHALVAIVGADARIVQ